MCPHPTATTTTRVQSSCCASQLNTNWPKGHTPCQRMLVCACSVCECQRMSARHDMQTQTPYAGKLLRSSCHVSAAAAGHAAAVNAIIQPFTPLHHSHKAGTPGSSKTRSCAPSHHSQQPNNNVQSHPTTVSCCRSGVLPHSSPHSDIPQATQSRVNVTGCLVVNSRSGTSPLLCLPVRPRPRNTTSARPQAPGANSPTHPVSSRTQAHPVRSTQTRCCHSFHFLYRNSTPAPSPNI